MSPWNQVALICLTVNRHSLSRKQRAAYQHQKELGASINLFFTTLTRSSLFSGGFNAGCISLRCVWGEIVVCNTFIFNILFWFLALSWVLPAWSRCERCHKQTRWWSRALQTWLWLQCAFMVPLKCRIQCFNSQHNLPKSAFMVNFIKMSVGTPKTPHSPTQ